LILMLLSGERGTRLLGWYFGRTWFQLFIECIKLTLIPSLIIHPKISDHSFSREGPHLHASVGLKSVPLLADFACSVFPDQAVFQDTSAVYFVVACRTCFAS